MKKAAAVFITAFICIIAFCAYSKSTISAHAAVSFDTIVEEVDHSVVQNAFGIPSGDIDYDCRYFQVDFVISGNSNATAFVSGGFTFDYNSDYFVPSHYPVGDPNPSVDYLIGSAATGFTFSSSLNTSSHMLAFGLLAHNSSKSSANGVIVSFLLKELSPGLWSNQASFFNDVNVVMWGGINGSISYSQPHSYTYNVTRVIGDLDGDGDADSADAQILTSIVQNNSYSVSNTTALYNLFHNALTNVNCSNMFVTVDGVEYIIPEIANVNQNAYINQSDATSILQYYINSLAGNSTELYIGHEYTFSWTIAY